MPSTVTEGFCLLCEFVEIMIQVGLCFIDYFDDFAHDDDDDVILL